MWNIIKLKKELFDEFLELKEKRAKFLYQLKYFRNIEEIEKTIQKLAKKGEAVPLLLWLYKEEPE